MYEINSDIRFDTLILKSSLRDYSDAYILVKIIITVSNIAAADADASNADKKVIFKYFSLFTYYISDIRHQ